ncbi:MAG: ABC transporter permease [Proteobacteria bacterium]|nr:ABC transporter permease [Pseudomonadota bacterium]MCP4918518.1 ABC transporter permease [Pseudomonadota bacterium]
MGLGVWAALRPPYRIREVFRQFHFVGVQSLTIVCVTGGFTGAVYALQAAYGFGLFDAEVLTGSTVTLSLARTLGPVFAALMITGRAGSAMAAEIGTMRVTEQVDALEAMAVDPIEYLVAPRIVAGTLMVPMAAAIFTAVGMFGAYLVGVQLLEINEGAFLYRIEWYADPPDLIWGLVKAAVFGFVIAVVGCAKGLSVRGGAAGVGKATTRAVVIASVSILVLDYFMTDLFMSTGLWI